MVTTGDDKKITTWSLYPNFQMIDQWVHPLIQKPIQFVSFHPTISDWLLTLDAEKTLTWWSLSQKEPLQMWRKCHSHVVHHVSFVPVTDSRAGSASSGSVVGAGAGGHRAVTCSADHSIKIWRLDEAKTHFASLHANAPFTAITFIGGEESSTTASETMI